MNALVRDLLTYSRLAREDVEVQPLDLQHVVEEARDLLHAELNERGAAMNRMLNGDAAPLADIWSHSATVTTMHPIGGRQVGWDEVRQSWEQVARLA